MVRTNKSNVQRDYVFGWLVAATAGEPMLGSLLTLKGGNALDGLHIREHGGNDGPGDY